VANAAAPFHQEGVGIDNGGGDALSQRLETARDSLDVGEGYAADRRKLKREPSFALGAHTSAGRIVARLVHVLFTFLSIAAGVTTRGQSMGRSISRHQAIAKPGNRRGLINGVLEATGEIPTDGRLVCVDGDHLHHLAVHDNAGNSSSAMLRIGMLALI
jgi:hypothetical protein